MKTGVPYIIMKLRIHKMNRTDLPIRLISQTLAFDDQMAFSKIFRKEMSMTPSAYRQQAKGVTNTDVHETENDYVTYLK